MGRTIRGWAREVDEGRGSFFGGRSGIECAASELRYEEDSPASGHAQLAHRGVTAFDLDDAKRLIAEAYFERVDVSTLTFPSTTSGISYLPPIWRGIWWPVQPI